MPQKSEVHPLEGKKAPAFTLASSVGTDVKLSSLKGSIVVLYFYPKDNTSGCTLEAQEFRDTAKEFGKAGAVVFGVSPDSIRSHCGFIEKHALNFQLLADPDHAVAEKYGVWVEKSMYGKKYMGIQRATFLIGADGKVVRVWSKVKPQGHAAEVLEAVKAITQG
jgi:thioredoxin-dependent peroxiredoxin